MRGAFVYLLDTADILLARLEDQRELLFKRDNFDDIGIHELEIVSTPGCLHGNKLTQTQYEDITDGDDRPQDGQSRRERLAATLDELSAKNRLRILSSLRTYMFSAVYMPLLTGSASRPG